MNREHADIGSSVVLFAKVAMPLSWRLLSFVCVLFNVWHCNPTGLSAGRVSRRCKWTLMQNLNLFAAVLKISAVNACHCCLDVAQIAVITIGQSMSNLGVIETANLMGKLTLWMYSYRWFTHHDCLIIDWMPALRLFGYAKRDLIGKKIDVIVPEPFASMHHQYMLRHIQSGREVTLLLLRFNISYFIVWAIELPCCVCYNVCDRWYWTQPGVCSVVIPKATSYRFYWTWNRRTATLQGYLRLSRPVKTSSCSRSKHLLCLLQHKSPTGCWMCVGLTHCSSFE